MRNGSTMSSAASACSTAALTPSALNECCMCCSTPLNTYGSRSHCSKPPKEERELKSHGTAHCHPCRQGSTDLRWVAYRSFSKEQTQPFCLQRPGSEALGVLDGTTAGRLHQVRRLELLDASDVRFRPRALRLAGREVKRGALVVDRARLAVDPAEAERLLDRGVVLDARFSGRLLPGHEPHGRGGLVVALEPVAPVRAIGQLHDLGLVAHTAWLPSAAATPPRSSPLSGRVELRSGTSRRSHVRRNETP